MPFVSDKVVLGTQTRRDQLRGAKPDWLLSCGIMKAATGVWSTWPEHSAHANKPPAAHGNIFCVENSLNFFGELCAQGHGA